MGEDEEVSIKQVTDAIVKALKFDGEYNFDTTRADGQFRKPASNKKLLDLMGGFQFTPFEKGTVIFFHIVVARHAEASRNSSGRDCPVVLAEL